MKQFKSLNRALRRKNLVIEYNTVTMSNEVRRPVKVQGQRRRATNNLITVPYSI